MEVSSAIALIGTIAYKPGWSITATDARKRFEGSINVRLQGPSRQTEREEAPVGYPTELHPYASFTIIVDDCDDLELYRRVFDKVMLFELHEAREFFRVLPTYWAPFHPHRIDGMRRWGDVEGDLSYGVA